MHLIRLMLTLLIQSGPAWTSTSADVISVMAQTLQSVELEGQLKDRRQPGEDRG